MDQKELARHNQIAWEAAAYDAWIEKYGAPETAANKIRSAPEAALARLLPYLGNPDGLKIANPLGSHGRVAIALSVLGADVTVFDVSRENAHYAQDVATSVNVDVNYIVGDFISACCDQKHAFDATVMDLGILHYFVSLDDFVHSVRHITKTAGRVVLTDFHPITTKALTLHEGAPKLTGDYFAAGIEAAQTPYAAFLDRKVPDCRVRRWTLAEVVTAFAQGFRITSLVEHPSSDCVALPGTFTLTAIAV